jgi:predicted ferric reductase
MTPTTVVESSPLPSPESLEKETGPSSPFGDSFPALEYPPLYFLLRLLPWLADPIRSLYMFRWRISYPLQRRVVLSRQLRYVGIYMTWGELLLMFPYYVAILCGLIYTIWSPSVAITGKIARYNLMAVLIFCQRNSLVTFLMGVPFDRGLFYHKLAGRVSGVTGLLHTISYFLDVKYHHNHPFAETFCMGAFTGSVNISGSAMFMFIFGIAISSLPCIRRRLFEFFYYLHILFTVAIVVCTFFHSGKLIPIFASCTWGMDLFIRSFVMARFRYPKKAQLKTMGESVIELKFPKNDTFDYNPGQYIYVAIPDISSFQWHPFSIISSPDQPYVTLNIRKVGGWTSALLDLAKTEKEVPMLMEGPYGNLSVDIMATDRKYRNALLICGGIGLTPMSSICDHLVNEIKDGRRSMRRIKFVWAERDPTFIEQSEFVRRQVQEFPQSTSDLTASSSGTDDSFSIFSDDESVYFDDDLEEEDDFENIYNMDIEDQCLADEQVLDMDIYLTAKSKSQLRSKSMRGHVRLGRPNISELFLAMKRDVVLSGSEKNHRVAVCVSGPRSLSHICRKACIKYSDASIRFDFHSESMAM